MELTVLQMLQEHNPIIGRFHQDQLLQMVREPPQLLFPVQVIRVELFVLLHSIHVEAATLVFLFPLKQTHL